MPDRLADLLWISVLSVLYYYRKLRDFEIRYLIIEMSFKTEFDRCIVRPFDSSLRGGLNIHFHFISLIILSLNHVVHRLKAVVSVYALWCLDTDNLNPLCEPQTLEHACLMEIDLVFYFRIQILNLLYFDVSLIKL